MKARDLIEALVNPNADEPFNKRLGRCYELAGRLASHNEDAVLVHGSIQGFGNPRIDHAWVELENGNVWEPASNQEWDRRVFNEMFNPRVNKKFDYESVLKANLQYSHWGPWDGTEPPVESRSATSPGTGSYRRGSPRRTGRQSYGKVSSSPGSAS